jgi:5-methyltetrahydrofolate--homocysteine methyltransferase
MIGGATTSKVHTAVKIDQHYTKGQTVHVLDASRSVTVVESLLGHKKELFVKELKEEYIKLRDYHEKHRTAKRLVSIDKARKNKYKIDWKAENIENSVFIGRKTLDINLEKLVPFIDWTPFFQTWELHGKYPDILKDEIVGVEAQKLFNDAQSLLNQIVKEGILKAKAVFGISQANAIEDDIEVKSLDNDGDNFIFHTLRQQTEKALGQPNIALADFVAPKESGLIDYLGGFVVTAGINLEHYIDQFEKNHDDYNSIMAKALADRLAEACAEYLHLLVRKDYWAYDKNETLSNEDLIKEKYQGIRPAPGYPACPDHTEKLTLFKWLNAQELVGVSLTESLAMWPTASVSGWYFANKEAKYFGLGKIQMDQVESIAQRKGFTLEEMTKWLSPNIN